MFLKKLCSSLAPRLSRSSGYPVQKDMEFLYNGVSKMYSGLGAGLSHLFKGLSVENGNHGRSFSVAIEGNIASGKTTLLNHFADCPFAEIHAEPVSRWRNVNGHNALGMMYKDPSHWALTFQTYVQLTMLEQHTCKPKKPVKLMERSIYSAKYCFVENLYNGGVMPELEYEVLTQWFDWIINNQDTHLDLIVYLRTSPEVVYERVKQRQRKEENTIPMEYLRALHDLHENWLIHKTSHAVNAPILVLDADEDVIEMTDTYETNRKQILCGYS